MADIAGYLGLAIETVNHSFTNLRQHRLISVDRLGNVYLLVLAVPETLG